MLSGLLQALSSIARRDVQFAFEIGLECILKSISPKRNFRLFRHPAGLRLSRVGSLDADDAGSLRTAKGKAAAVVVRTSTGVSRRRRSYVRPAVRFALARAKRWGRRALPAISVVLDWYSCRCSLDRRGYRGGRRRCHGSGSDSRCGCRRLCNCLRQWCWRLGMLWGLCKTQISGRCNWLRLR